MTRETSNCKSLVQENIIQIKYDILFNFSIYATNIWLLKKKKTSVISMNLENKQDYAYL